MICKKKKKDFPTFHQFKDEKWSVTADLEMSFGF